MHANCLIFIVLFSFQFSILLIVIFLFEIGIGVAGYMKRDQLDQILDEGFNKTLKNYKPNEEAWRLLQTEVWNQIFKINSHLQ